MKSRVISLLIILFAVQSVGAAPTWPVVKPEIRSFHVQLPSSDPGVAMTISDRTGNALYQIQCGTYDSSISAFAYSGEFECMLQTVPPNYKHSTLFTEYVHQDKDWESRARFFAKEVADPCGGIPEFGRVRSFKLRGMKIILSMSNITFAGKGPNQKLKSFDFQVAVELDPTATTPITKYPVLDPKWKSLPCPLDESAAVHFRPPAIGPK